ncbi:FecR domain-containing protein [Candidatus Nitrospira bockiana]
MTLLILRLAALVAMLAPAVTSHAGTKSIGIFATVEGAVTVSRETTPAPRPVKYQDEIILRDVIETQRRAYAKVLFEDDTLLSVPEHSRIQISEHVYDPARGVRSAIVQLTQGAVRALVGRVFTGAGSRFEVHTATAVAAARGTYFVVWVEPHQTTGLANIGDKGDVAFTAGGETIIVKPGYYSVAHPGAVPTPPVPLDHSVHEVKQVIAATDCPDSVIEESPKTALRHHPLDPLLPAPTNAVLVYADGVSLTNEPGTLSALTGALTGSGAMTTLSGSVTTVGGGTVSATTGVLSPVMGSTLTTVGSTVTAVGAVAPVVSTAGAGVTTAVTSVAPTVSPLTTPITQTLGTLRP